LSQQLVTVKHGMSGKHRKDVNWSEKDSIWTKFAHTHTRAGEGAWGNHSIVQLEMIDIYYICVPLPRHPKSLFLNFAAHQK